MVMLHAVTVDADKTAESLASHLVSTPRQFAPNSAVEKIMKFEKVPITELNDGDRIKSGDRTVRIAYVLTHKNSGDIMLVINDVNSWHHKDKLVLRAVD